jgi:hypothetical protein
MELQRNAIQAVAQACRLRAVIEDVAEMAAATTAMHRLAHHAELRIPRGADHLAVKRCVCVTGYVSAALTFERPKASGKPIAARPALNINRRLFSIVSPPRANSRF